MHPIPFKGHNCTYAKDQPEYKPLPAFKDDGPQGQVVTCWNLGFWERLRLLLTGKVWVCMLTFNGPLSPLKVSSKKSDFLQDVKHNYEEETGFASDRERQMHIHS